MGEFARLESHPPVGFLAAVIDPFEHGRCGQKLEGAAHRKALVGTMAGQGARAAVQDSDAEPSAAACFKRGKILAEPVQSAGCGVSSST